MAVVVAEGGAKAQKKYAKLLLHRIPWAAGREDDADAAGAPGSPPGPPPLRSAIFRASPVLQIG